MAYATPEELAEALGKRLTDAERPKYQRCLDAAAVEIDHYIDAVEATAPDDPLANRVNLLRGVEWWKANDAAFGVIGYSDTGSLTAPRDTFARHGRTLIPLKQRWGIA